MCLPYVNLYLYAIYVNQASLMYDNVITNQHCQVNTDNTGVTTVTADFVIFMKKKLHCHVDCISLHRSIYV